MKSRTLPSFAPPPSDAQHPAPAIEPSAAATPMAFVRAIVLAYTRRGLSADAALAAAQIAPQCLGDDHARINAAQMERISGHAMHELDDEALGWFERRLPWGSYGMLVRASLSAPNLRRAWGRWCRHHGLLTESIALRLSSTGTVATLELSEARALGALREFCLVSVLRNAHGVACWLVDSRIPLIAVDLPFSAPPHASAYGVLFNGPVRFNAARTALHLDARYLALPLRRDEAALNQMLQRALPLTVWQYRRDRLLVQRVRQLLGAPSAPGGGAALAAKNVSAALAAHSAESLAAQLHMSPRTLHRQLKEEGATLQALKDEARHSRAVELLHRSDRPIKQVAAAAGFANEKSFIRAFRGWSGQSPADFRRAARAQVAPSGATNTIK